MNGSDVGFGVVSKVSQLWTITTHPVGHSPDGPDGMTPRTEVKGWVATPVTGLGGQEVRHFTLGESLTGHDPDVATIPVSLVYDQFFPTREMAIQAHVREQVEKKIGQIQRAFDLAIHELKLELNALAGEIQ